MASSAVAINARTDVITKQNESNYPTSNHYKPRRSELSFTVGNI